jgi:hypothetical protein
MLPGGAPRTLTIPSDLLPLVAAHHGLTVETTASDARVVLDGTVLRAELGARDA